MKTIPNDCTLGSVKLAVRKFTTDKLLRFIGKTTAAWAKEDNGNFRGQAKRIDVSLSAGNVIHTQSVLVSSWKLLDVAYYSILYSNDHRGKCIETEEELAILAGVVGSYIERIESERLSHMSKVDVLYHLQGFAGEQFFYQAEGKSISNAARDLFIITRCLKQSMCSEIQTIFRERMGCEPQEVVKYLLLAWFVSTLTPKLQDIDNYFKIEQEYLEQYYSIIDYYTLNYDQIKKSSMERQVFYTKPFVETTRGEIICFNPALCLHLLEHSVLWIARDYYNEHNSNSLVNAFGEGFECYLEQLLNYHLTNDQFKRIAVEKCKRADWELEIEGFSFLVEQKSGLLGLDAKQQLPSIEQIEKYFKKTVLKAYNQLVETERARSKKYVKIVLMYEDYLDSDLLNVILFSKDSGIQNDGYFWYVSIQEFELLLELYSQSPASFVEIVNSKIQKEIANENEGKSLLHLISECSKEGHSSLLDETIEQMTNYNTIIKNK